MRLLKVQGKGHVNAEPDMVKLSFDVEVDVYDYGKCLSTLNARVDNLRQSMSGAGLERTELKTSSFDVRVKTEYRGGQHVFAGYTASHRMHIDLPVDKDLLNQVLHHVANSHSGAQINISFSVRDKNSLLKQVLTQAVKTAKTNAETLASAAGVKLGKLVEMEYGWSEVRVYDREASMVCQESSPMDIRADIEPEDVHAEDTVTLVYELEE